MSYDGYNEFHHSIKLVVEKVRLFIVHRIENITRISHNNLIYIFDVYNFRKVTFQMLKMNFRFFSKFFDVLVFSDI